MTGKLVLSVACLCLAVMSASAQDAPDMTGTWQVQVERSSMEKSDKGGDWIINHFAYGDEGREVSLMVEISRQDGIFLYGEKATPGASEPIIGVVDYEPTRVEFVDSDGNTSCRVTGPDEMRCIYVEINEEDSTIARSAWTRDP